MLKEYKIYRLVLDGETVYVGQTTQELKKRKAVHNSKNTFERIIESEIELIEITTDVTRERYWIEYYINKDCKLFNIKRGATGLTYEEYQIEYKQTEKWKEYQKEWNKSEKAKYYQKEYREKNKEKKNEQQIIRRAKKKLEKLLQNQNK